MMGHVNTYIDSIFNGITEMQAAANFGLKETPITILKQGPDVQARDDSENTALHWAASTGNETAIQFLLEQGANIKSKSGQTALFNATGLGHERIIRLLMKHSANIKAKVNNRRNGTANLSYKWR